VRLDHANTAGVETKRRARELSPWVQCGRGARPPQKLSLHFTNKLRDARRMCGNFSGPSAFSTALPDIDRCEGTDANVSGEFGEAVRGALSEAYFEILHPYHRYFIPSLPSISQEKGARKTARELFDVEGYLSACDDYLKGFLELFLQTDLFLSFVEDRQDKDGDMFALTSFDIDYLEHQGGGKGGLRRILKLSSAELDACKEMKRQLIRALPFRGMELKVEFKEVPEEQLPRSPSTTAVLKAVEHRRRARSSLQNEVSSLKMKLDQLRDEVKRTESMLTQKTAALARLEKKAQVSGDGTDAKWL